MFSHTKNSGGEGVRTPDPRLAKPMLSQLSYTPKWSGRQDSNLRPSGPKPDALPDCATPRWSHLSDSNRRPSDYKSEALAN